MQTVAPPPRHPCCYSPAAAAAARRPVPAPPLPLRPLPSSSFAGLPPSAPLPPCVPALHCTPPCISGGATWWWMFGGCRNGMGVAKARSYWGKKGPCGTQKQHLAAPPTTWRPMPAAPAAAAGCHLAAALPRRRAGACGTARDETSDGWLAGNRSDRAGAQVQERGPPSHAPVRVNRRL